MPTGNAGIVGGMGMAVLNTIIGVPTCNATTWDPYQPAITMACRKASREIS